MIEKSGGNMTGNIAEILTGGGEMSERIRQFDWTKTTLGAIENWQQSLITAVNLILNSRFSMFVWWGEELTYIYNDAYLPTLGIRHPRLWENRRGKFGRRVIRAGSGPCSTQFSRITSAWQAKCAPCCVRPACRARWMSAWWRTFFSGGAST
ncbi:MAG: hypothetical protein HC846_05820, partial [Blastocatellia bacterium]|nr:hypothetical protein [Blastocatellia bacterium]